MPIHDQGYRRYLGTRSALGRSWQVMTRAGVLSVITKRVFMGVMLMAWIPFIVRAVSFYVAANFQQATFLAPNGKVFVAGPAVDTRYLDCNGLGEWSFLANHVQNYARYYGSAVL